jgi:hypothetical protein
MLIGCKDEVCCLGGEAAVDFFALAVGKLAQLRRLHRHGTAALNELGRQPTRKMRPESLSRKACHADVGVDEKRAVLCAVEHVLRRKKCVDSSLLPRRPAC